MLLTYAMQPSSLTTCQGQDKRNLSHIYITQIQRLFHNKKMPAKKKEGRENEQFIVVLRTRDFI